MNVSQLYDFVISIVRQSEFSERLFLASLELVLLATIVGLIAAFYRSKFPRLVAILWIVVLAKPVIGLCIGSPMPVLELASATAEFEAPHPSQPTSPIVGTQNRALANEGASSNQNSNPFGIVDDPTSLASQAPCVDVAKAASTPVPEAIQADEHDLANATNSATVLLLTWVTGVAFVCCLSFVSQIRLWRIVGLSRQAEFEIQNRFEQLAREQKIQRLPRLRVTDRLDSPAIAGIIRPVILVPQWLAAEGADSKALTWSLRHELNHWKVGDPFFNIICGITSALFFFHPVVWIAVLQWRYAMEMACDRDVIRRGSDTNDYVDALYHVLASVRNRPTLANSLFATRTQIGKRIEVLLSKHINLEKRLNPVLLSAFTALSLAILLLGSGFADAEEGVLDGRNQAQADANEAAHSDSTTVFNNSDDTSTSTIKHEHVSVRYVGVRKEYAEAVARVVGAARNVAVSEFGYAMPDSIRVTLTVNPGSPVRLFNDGDRNFSLNIHSEKDLLRPATSGKFHIYGLCHEVGHLAMYRPIQNRRWMTTAAAEGWAHYIGSHLVDRVYKNAGEELWPDAYDYRKDGTRRLEYQLLAHSSNIGMQPTTLGASLWKQLGETIDNKQIADVFQAWGEADFDSDDLGEELGRLLVETTKNEKTRFWWERARTVFVVQTSKSQFVRQSVDSKLVRDERELALDNGKDDGKQSIAGGGHAVKFQVDNDSSVLTSVRIHGARYGSARAPDEDFHVWLCDSEFNEIADFAFPYSKFSRGRSKWVKLKVDPILVPRDFLICVGFNPTATKGVFVSRDDQVDGSSFTGLPGRTMRAYGKGDWLIRATVGTLSATRQWKDASGKFSVEAEFVELTNGQVKLKRKDGQIISVALERLSHDDQVFLKSVSQANEGHADRETTEQHTPLSKQRVVLKKDDGKAAGRRSFPQGFAVELIAKNETSHLTSVKVHGARYGSVRAPNEDFEVSLCDENFKMIKQFKFPYSKFARGETTWVTLPVEPTKVPKKFVICLNFRPTRTKGVFVSHDAEGRGLMGTPGKIAGSFSGGDWLIRAEVTPSASDK